MPSPSTSASSTSSANTVVRHRQVEPPQRRLQLDNLKLRRQQRETRARPWRQTSVKLATPIGISTKHNCPAKRAEVVLPAPGVPEKTVSRRFSIATTAYSTSPEPRVASPAPTYGELIEKFAKIKLTPDVTMSTTSSEYASSQASSGNWEVLGVTDDEEEQAAPSPRQTAMDTARLLRSRLRRLRTPTPPPRRTGFLLRTPPLQVGRLSTPPSTPKVERLASREPCSCKQCQKFDWQQSMIDTIEHNRVEQYLFRSRVEPERQGLADFAFGRPACYLEFVPPVSWEDKMAFALRESIRTPSVASTCSFDNEIDVCEREDLGEAYGRYIRLTTNAMLSPTPAPRVRRRCGKSLPTRIPQPSFTLPQANQRPGYRPQPARMQTKRTIKPSRIPRRVF